MSKSYEDKLSCKKKKCRAKASGALTVPLKLITKGDKLLDIARCPICHDSYKVVLGMSDRDKWIPLIGKAFFTCDVCGTLNEDGWQVTGSDRLKVITTCKSCRKKRAKVISRNLWDDVVSQIKKPIEPPAPELKCPHCEAPITEGQKVCPKCNTEILCDKCGSLIAPGAGFCSNCGDKVEKFEPPPTTPPLERECPTCSEEYPEGAKFCAVCGQELVCDKCGAPIREGAQFCTQCGDPVQKGSLSE